MDRREFLALGSAGLTSFSGCSSASQLTPDSTESTDKPTEQPGETTIEITGPIEGTEFTVGDILEVAVTVTNTGTRAETVELVLALDGTAVTSETVHVPAGDEVSVTLSTTISSIEPVGVTVNGEHVRDIFPAEPNLEEYQVAEDGDDEDSLGRESDPLATIQEALERAKPGATIHVSSGEYRETFHTVRPGEPDKPITLSGPEDAIVRPPLDNFGRIFSISHSHIHLTGLTLTGLADPERSDDPAVYAYTVVGVGPDTHPEPYPDYLTDIKIKPHKLGHARERLINGVRTNKLEIGEFEIIGPSGVAHLLGDSEGYVIGAFIGLGRSANNFGTDHYPWDEPDESHNVHIHHIANLDGYYRTEFVKLHAGMYDVTIEYCTERGGSGRDDSPDTRRSIKVPSGDTTIRWCELTGWDEDGIVIRVPRMRDDGTYQYFESIPDERFPGTNNAIYGNLILDKGGKAIAFSLPDWLGSGPENQRVVCGNEVNGETDGNPNRACPDSVPSGDGIGYAGGDSPWDD